MASVFLYAPRDFNNLCLLARTLEVFGHRECYIFDPHRLVRERYGKSRLRDLRASSGGAFQKIQWLPILDPQQLIHDHAGRVVATVASSEAAGLAQFRFSVADLLVFGPETHGLPAAMVAACGAAVTIPTQGQTQSLNLAVALGVFLFEWHRQASSADGQATG